MDEDRKPDEPIHITSAQARGAGDADENTQGATLLPMLIAGLVLVIVGVAIILMIVR